jgi:hypothetical protein
MPAVLRAGPALISSLSAGSARSSASGSNSSAGQAAITAGTEATWSSLRTSVAWVRAPTL